MYKKNSLKRKPRVKNLNRFLPSLVDTYKHVRLHDGSDLPPRVLLFSMALQHALTDRWVVHPPACSNGQPQCCSWHTPFPSLSKQFSAQQTLLCPGAGCSSPKCWCRERKLTGRDWLPHLSGRRRILLPVRKGNRIPEGRRCPKAIPWENFGTAAGAG